MAAKKKDNTPLIIGGLLLGGLIAGGVYYNSRQKKKQAIIAEIMKLSADASPEVLARMSVAELNLALIELQDATAMNDRRQIDMMNTPWEYVV